jgi:hypothetical protein
MNFNQFIKIIILLSIVFFENSGITLPSSSFIIVPVVIKNEIYMNDKSVFRIESSDEDLILPETANQKIVSINKSNEKTVILLSTGKNRLAPGNDLNPYLKNTPYLNMDKDIIRKTAADFKNSKDPLKDVSLFVYRYISDKKIGIPMISALSILKRKAGDCTEHSILTVSLLRTLKIPARAIVGLILTENFEGNKNVFVFHMWVEAYRNGKWEMIDSTRPLNVYHNRYIALAYHNLMTETPMEFLTVASSINDIKISYIK